MDKLKRFTVFVPLNELMDKFDVVKPLIAKLESWWIIVSVAFIELVDV